MILIIHIVVNVILIYLGLIVFLRDKKNATNIIFSLIALLNSLWSFANYFSVTFPPEQILIWIRLVIFFAIPHAILFAIFMSTFPHEKIYVSRKILVLIIFWMFIMMFISLTPLVFEGIKIKNNIPIPTPGKLIGFITFTFFAALGYGIFIGVQKYYKESMQNKKLWKYIVGGAILSYSSIIITQFIMVNFFKNTIFVYYGPVFILPFVLGTVYSIFKYQALNVRITWAEIFIFLMIGSITFQLLTSKDDFNLLLNFLVLIFSIILSGFLIENILKEIKYRERLEELNRLKSEFLSFASHQVKAPMAVVKGYAELIMEGIENVPEQAKDFAKKIKESVDNLLVLIEEFMDYRRIEEGKMELNFEKIDIVSLIKEIVEKMKLLAKEKNLNLEFESNTDSLLVNVDKIRFSQVIQNLIDNAIKYTKEGWVKVKVDRKDNEVLISVSDSGIGMSKELQEKLFGQFVRDPSIKKEIRGTGLGLYIAKYIVEAHQGKIWAESEGIGRGSTFYIKLPLRE